MTVQGRKRVQREPRRQMNGRSAWVTMDDGETRHECAVIDVAPGGAKITMHVEIDVGGRFELALVPTHPKLQQCEVVWRRDHSFGVKFLPAGASQASHAPVADGPAEPVVQAADSQAPTA
jgi:PilZ domain